jgi:outer membrane biosynthesis protein TonB
MLPQTQPTPPQNSSKVNLTISLIFHAVLVGALFYFAAREGLLGKKIQKISITLEQEKAPEKPKVPDQPKVEPPKEVPRAEPPKVAEPAPPPTPSVAAPPVMAPPPTEVASFAFDGGKSVNSETDPVQLYKGYLEYTLRSQWRRPDNMADDEYVAEVAVTVDAQGKFHQVQWRKGSGDDRWDQSVQEVFKLVPGVDRRPPTNFPPQVVIRFDVQDQTEPVMPP